MTQVAENELNKETIKVSYSNSEEEFGIPLSGDLASLLAIQEMKEVLVHDKPLLLNTADIHNYLNNPDTGVGTAEELGKLLESRLSKEDVEVIYNKQLHRRLRGQEFQVTEVGSLEPKATEDFKIIVPQVKVAVEIVEQAIESVMNDDLSKYTVYLPPTSKEEELNPVRCITGNVMRVFLNGIQDEDSGLDMNAQILVYAKLLTMLSDDDATKKFGLSQMRHLMQYGDVVSNKGLRLAITSLLEEGSELVV